MKRIMCLLPFALLILLPLLPLSSQVILSPEKISISAWVTTDRQCVSDCVEEIEIMVNCEANSCLCRPDVVPTGESHLSDCVASDECDGIDISAATMRYSEYCSAYSAELQGLPASIPATTTTAASSASNTFLTDISTGTFSFPPLPLRGNEHNSEIQLTFPSRRSLLNRTNSDRFFLFSDLFLKLFSISIIVLQDWLLVLWRRSWHCNRLSPPARRSWRIHTVQ